MKIMIRIENEVMKKVSLLVVSFPGYNEFQDYIPNETVENARKRVWYESFSESDGGVG